MAKCEFYVTVEPTFAPYGNGIRSIRATSITKKQPQRLTRNGSVSVKLVLDIPDGAFLPLRPEAIVVVPEDMTRTNLPIRVTATDPDDTDEG